MAPLFAKGERITLGEYEVGLTDEEERSLKQSTTSNWPDCAGNPMQIHLRLVIKNSNEIQEKSFLIQS